MFLFPTPVLVLSWKNRFFLGSNKVLQIALGRTAADELKEDLHKVTEFLHGDCGLFLTNLPKDEAIRQFEEFEAHDFARTGSLATETVLSCQLQKCVSLLFL
jgi:mRNA turnover protein 4